MKPFFTQSAEEVLQQLNVAADKGLSSSEAKQKLEEFGPNQ